MASQTALERKGGRVSAPHNPHGAAPHLSDGREPRCPPQHPCTDAALGVRPRCHCESRASGKKLNQNQLKPPLHFVLKDINIQVNPHLKSRRALVSIGSISFLCGALRSFLSEPHSAAAGLRVVLPHSRLSGGKRLCSLSLFC